MMAGIRKGEPALSGLPARLVKVCGDLNVPAQQLLRI
jgi:hypothetical protein